MFPSRPVQRAIAAAALVLTAPATLADAAPFDSNTFGGLAARSLGPAVMSGRVAAIDGVPTDPVLLYVGAASGGVWRSKDGGVTFSPVFDDHAQSIGAIRVAPSQPEVVWVGTGEGWVRNSVSVGDGVYRSLDGGETWTHVGLGDSERIAAIQVSPHDPDVAFVCAMGHLWNDGGERGVYRTRDGGASWDLVLPGEGRTGCADLAMDPKNETILFAALWDFRRAPDFFESGGPGSGLYRSVDGGEHWERLAEGLPTGALGRIAVAIAPSRPGTVYATVEAESTALYRSDDLGSHWERLNESNNIQMRPFYFSELVVDPQDHRRVYKPGFTLTVSTDGGEAFSSMFGPGYSVAIHPDHHALWIDPRNPQDLYLGTDGGVYISHDRASHWRLVGTLPIAQYYHVSHDDAWPYNVYGGLQDNGSWVGPSRAAGGIGPEDWQNVGPGDGFWVFADPEDPRYVYSEYQGGNLLRVDRELGERRAIAPVPASEDERLRFNWNTPLVLSRHVAGRLYYGSQFLHVSDDRGESWRRSSPDLTTDDPERQRQETSGGLTIDNSTAENNATIYTIAESAFDPDVLWVGSDDGRLHVTRDGGERWVDLTARVPDVPPGTWISRITVSEHTPGTALVTFDGHRTGDMATYVFRATNFGEHFERLPTDGVRGWAWIARQDPVNPALLYLGTELGLYLSLDGGAHWARFDEGLPPVAVHDLVVHPTEHDLVLATHGRGVYVIDDLSPLRALTEEVIASNVALLPSRPAVLTAGGALQGYRGHDQFVAANPPEAASIAFYLRRRHLFGDLKVRVYDQAGRLVTEFPGGKRPGINRVSWPMRLKPPRMPPSTTLLGESLYGPRVAEGTYRIELVKGKERLAGTVTVTMDPRSPHSAEDRAAQQELARRLYDGLEDLAYTAESLAEARATLDERLAVVPSEQRDEALEGAMATARDAIDGLLATLAVQSSSGMLAGQEKLREKLGSLYGSVNSFDGRPTATQFARSERLLAAVREAEEAAEAIVSGELRAANERLEAVGLAPVVRPERASWNEGSSGGGAVSGALLRAPTRWLAAIRGF